MLTSSCPPNQFNLSRRGICYLIGGSKFIYIKLFDLDLDIILSTKFDKQCAGVNWYSAFSFCRHKYVSLWFLESYFTTFAHSHFKYLYFVQVFWKAVLKLKKQWRSSHHTKMRLLKWSQRKFCWSCDMRNSIKPRTLFFCVYRSSLSFVTKLLFLWCCYALFKSVLLNIKYPTS